MNFYLAADQTEKEPGLRQGDIIGPVPFLAFSLNRAAVLWPDQNQPSSVDLTQGDTVSGTGHILASVEFSLAVILNQSCDLSGEPGREKPILAARALPCEKRLKGFDPKAPLKRMTVEIKTLGNPGKHPNLFYLPELSHPTFFMPRSVADLLETVCFPPINHDGLSRLRKARLSDEALKALQERLAYCFGRFGAPDHLYFNQDEWDFELNRRKGQEIITEG